MNENAPQHGVDPVGFVLGAFISAAILAFQSELGWYWLLYLPILTALIGFPIAAVIYGEARRAFADGFQAGLDAAKR
jgi:hypothetical protein